MERKNMVLLTVIAVATLLVAVVGATFAYFTATVTDSRTGDENNGQTNVTAGQVASETVINTTTGAAGSFTATGVYPGHKEVAGLSVNIKSSDSNTATSKIKLVWKGKSTFETTLKVSVYKATTDVSSVAFTCTKATGTGTGEDANNVTYYETCNTLPEGIGSVLATKDITTETTTLDLYTDTITSDNSDAGTTYYYYVVVEYPNNTESTSASASQNNDFGKNLTGKVTVELTA